MTAKRNSFVLDQVKRQVQRGNKLLIKLRNSVFYNQKHPHRYRYATFGAVTSLINLAKR